MLGLSDSLIAMTAITALIQQQQQQHSIPDE
jgi:hypothetical protein